MSEVVVLFYSPFLFLFGPFVLFFVFYLTTDTQTVQRGPEKSARFSKQKLIYFVLKNGPAFQGLFEQSEYL